MDVSFVAARFTPRVARFIVGVLFGVGIVGLSHPLSRPLFVLLTPGFLLINAAVLAWFHTGAPIISRQTGLRMGAVLVGGYLIELLGVHTGWPFGTYSYSGVLGPRLWQVPPLIGLNWLLLTYLSADLARDLLSGQTRLLQASLTAALLLWLDLWLEPAAIWLGFWHWAGGTPPLQNYLAWAVAGWGFAWLLLPVLDSVRNTLSRWIYLCFFCFFLAMTLVSLMV